MDERAVKLGDWLAERPFVLALSSGFFAFFAHAGMLEVLVERGLSPRMIAGSSAGALVGGTYAAGVPVRGLTERLAALRRSDFWDPAPGAGLLAGRRFDRVLRELLPISTFDACPLPVRISVFDIARRRTEVLGDGDLAHAIRASCAVPGMFHPVWIARRAYWDGGILDRPGLAGVAPGERTLLHHIASRSPWRRSRAAPRRSGMVTFAIAGLPRSGPFRLDAGRRALELAREATRRALDATVRSDGEVLVTNC
jgi:NTE family protein